MPDGITKRAARVYLIDKIISLVARLAKYAAICVMGYFTTEVVSELAGRSTVTEISIEFLKRPPSVVVSYILSGGFLVLYLIQRRLRKTAILHFGKVRSKLEAKLDPDRTSSNLTEAGETSPEDEL